MATINEVLDAVAASLKSTGWVCSTNVDNPPVPCVLLYPDDNIGNGQSYFETMARGVVTIPIVANVMVSTVNNVNEARRLNDAISPFGATSIVDALFHNVTLGTDPDEATGGAGARMTASVVGVNEYGIAYTFDGQTRVLQAKVRINVKTRGDR